MVPLDVADETSKRWVRIAGLRVELELPDGGSNGVAMWTAGLGICISSFF